MSRRLDGSGATAQRASELLRQVLGQMGILVADHSGPLYLLHSIEYKRKKLVSKLAFGRRAYYSSEFTLAMASWTRSYFRSDELSAKKLGSTALK